MPPVAAPDQLADALQQLVRQAVDEAAEQAPAPGRLTEIVDDALQEGQEAVQLAGEQLERLKDQAVHPDWLSLLTFALVRAVELANDPHLTVVAYPPRDTAWSRGVALRYAQPLPDGDEAVVTLALLIGDPDKKHGVALRVKHKPTVDFAAGPARIRVSGDGADGEWLIAFGAGVPAPTGLTALDVDVRLLDPFVRIEDGGLRMGLGVPRVTASVRVGTQGAAFTWSLDVALEGGGTAAPAGAHASIDFRAFLGDALAQMVQIEPIAYSPILRLRPGVAPTFDLRHGERT